MSDNFFEEWAKRWNISDLAIAELFEGTLHLAASEDNDRASEALVQSEVRLEAAALDIYLFRNNVGAGKLDSGNFVRFGLANDSAPVNKNIKSGDLIGLRKRLITPDMIGTYIGQFISRENKRRDWKYSGTIEENAQMRWATLINSLGGDAKIINGPGSFDK